MPPVRFLLLAALLLFSFHLEEAARRNGGGNRRGPQTQRVGRGPSPSTGRGRPSPPAGRRGPPPPTQGGIDRFGQQTRGGITNRFGQQARRGIDRFGQQVQRGLGRFGQHARGNGGRRQAVTNCHGKRIKRSLEKTPKCVEEGFVPKHLTTSPRDTRIRISQAGDFTSNPAKQLFLRDRITPVTGKYNDQFKFVTSVEIPTVNNGRTDYGKPSNPFKQFFMTTGRKIKDVRDWVKDKYKPAHLDGPVEKDPNIAHRYTKMNKKTNKVESFYTLGSQGTQISHTDTLKSAGEKIKEEIDRKFGR